ncbi:MAG: hypothetical protein J6K53_01040 [Roseburia sp.]|nr:hypothetical protein [Roseburia sp.]
MKKKISKAVLIFLCIACAIYIVRCISIGILIKSKNATRLPEESTDAKVYYAINVDGMKGLGHSILLIEMENGEGLVISYNGMQRSLAEALMGMSGVGKMSVVALSETQMDDFFATGNISVGLDQLDDNYDFVLSHVITEEDYQAVIKQLEPYYEAERAYASIYGNWVSANDDEKPEYERQLEELANDESVPLYRIYRHNCDDVARELLAGFNSEIASYNEHKRHLTPSGNFKALALALDDWELHELGDNSVKEAVLYFFMII